MSKSFYDRGMAYLEAQKLEFLKDYVGTELEADATRLAQELNWILPNETLMDTPAIKLFEPCDFFGISNDVKNDSLTEKQGTQRVAAEVRKIRQNLKARIAEIGKSHGNKMTHSKPPQQPYQDAPVALTGIPECMGKNTVVLYGFRINGRDVFAFKKDAERLLKAVDGRHPVTAQCYQSRWWCVAEEIEAADTVII